MSYTTEAILFWGFPLGIVGDIDSFPTKDEVTASTYGSDGDVGYFLCIKKSLTTVYLDSVARVYPEQDCDPLWSSILRKYCKINDVPWPDAGPGWHLTASRF